MFPSQCGIVGLFMKKYCFAEQQAASNIFFSIRHNIYSLIGIRCAPEKLPNVHHTESDSRQKFLKRLLCGRYSKHYILCCAKIPTYSYNDL